MKYIFFLAVIFILFVSVIAIESIRECKKFKITHYTFNDIDSENFGELKIAFFADLHNTWFGGDNSSLENAIREYGPDVIILAGDMVVCRSNQVDENLKTATFINRLSHIAPVYYGMGNHETGVKYRYDDVGDNWEDYVRLLETNVNILIDKSVEIKKDKTSFYIHGLALLGKYYSRLKKLPLSKKDIEDKLGNPEKTGYNILIAHNPDYFKVYAEWGADLVLSGHNHGGLVRLPGIGGIISPRLQIFPRYTYGVYKSNETKMVLTNGLGAHSMKIRVGNIPEIVFMDIKAK